MTSIYGEQVNEITKGTKEFFASNGLISKFSYTLMILIVFILLFQIGSYIVTTLFAPSSSPYIVNGMIDGKQYMKVDQDPRKGKSVTILRSDDESKGIEFTWSFWVFLEDMDYNKGKYRHIFHKGEVQTLVEEEDDEETTDDNENDFQDDETGKVNINNIQKKTGINFPNNSPGLYLGPNDNTLYVFMNTFSSIMEQIVIKDVPMNKWVNIMIRCQDKTVDVYLNGVIAKRHVLDGVPKQNYGSLYTGVDGGFGGYLSNLKYFDHAVGTKEITDVINEGISTKFYSPKPGTYDSANYLSSQWYGMNDIGKM